MSVFSNVTADRLAQLYVDYFIISWIVVACVVVVCALSLLFVVLRRKAVKDNISRNDALMREYSSKLDDGNARRFAGYQRGGEVEFTA
jgi:hypothetical protein